METHVEFRSDIFPPCEGEENEVNPGRYGKRLAKFLRTGLQKQGYVCDEPIATDWGWVVQIKNDSFSLWVGCGNYDQYPDGFLCFIEPHTGTVRKFFRKLDVSVHIETLRGSMDKLLAAEPSVREKRWWTHEAFNKPQS